MALEEVLSDLGKTVTLYCPVDIPKYLRYIRGWDRVVGDFPACRLAIIVDTSADVLLSKVLETPGDGAFLETRSRSSTLHFGVNPEHEHTMLSDASVATGSAIPIVHACRLDHQPASSRKFVDRHHVDSLGLTTPNTTLPTFHVAGELTALGASNAEIEERRREFMKKSPEILAYKGKLIERIEYLLDGQLASGTRAV